MKQINKKNIKIFAALSLLLLFVAVGMTVAYYTSMKDFENEFHVKKPGVIMYERFNPTDWWVPGEEKEKEAKFVNTGELDMLLRFKVEIAWEGEGPQKWSETTNPPGWTGGDAIKDDGKPYNPEDIIDLYWQSSAKGEKILLSEATGKEGFHFEYKDGYYYYKKVLKAEDQKLSETQNVLESVQFKDNLSNDGHKHSNFSDFQVNVTITGETILVDPKAAKEKWGLTPTIKSDEEVQWQ